MHHRSLLPTDVDRFERLLIAEIPRLRRYARALTGDRAFADDLVQDCLVRAISRRRLWLPSRALGPWLFRILHNLHVNAARATRRERLRRQEPGSNPDGERSAPGPDGEVGGMALRDLDRALQGLPLEQREVVLLVGLEGLSYKDTARTLGVPVGTVMSRLSRGRERLRDALDADGAASRRRAR